MVRPASDLKTKVLLAAYACSSGTLENAFTFEQLLVKAWEMDPVSWGLRGFEQDHPDSERIHRELDSRGKKNKGMVDMGFLDKVQARVYRLTLKGLTAASELLDDEPDAMVRTDRVLENEVHRILEHPVFKAWLADNGEPKHFRDAGHFWGVAPGTPPKVIEERLRRVDQAIEAGVATLDGRGVDAIGSKKGSLAFDRNDLERIHEYQETLKHRFTTDLKTLGVDAFSES